MKTIFAYSDTHNNILSSDVEAVMACCDYIVFLGDGLKNSLKYYEMFKGKFYAVKGNCDFLSNADEEIVLNIEDCKIMLVHGHEQGVKRGLINLLYYAKEKNVNAVLFGHTHEFSASTEEGVTLINVGSYGNSISGDNGYTFITVDRQNILAKFVKSA